MRSLEVTKGHWRSRIGQMEKCTRDPICGMNTHMISLTNKLTQKVISGHWRLKRGQNLKNAHRAAIFSLCNHEIPEQHRLYHFDPKQQQKVKVRKQMHICT